MDKNNKYSRFKTRLSHFNKGFKKLNKKLKIASIIILLLLIFALVLANLLFTRIYSQQAFENSVLNFSK